MDIHHIGPEHISKNISGVYLQKNIFRKTSPDMDIHHIGLEHIAENISGVYLQKMISGHGYTSHWSGAYLQKYLRSVSPEKHLQTWIYITLVWSMSLEICLECISRR